MIKVYLSPKIEGLKYIDLINPNLNIKNNKTFFDDFNVFNDLSENVVEIVSDIDQAQYIMIPYNILHIDNLNNYLNSIRDISKSKKIIAFIIGDSDIDIKIDNSIIFRMSCYGIKIRENEIIIPAYANDLSKYDAIKFRVKNEMPVISFCGWAGVQGFYSKIKYFIKNYLILKGPYKQGIYFRRKAIKILNKSKLVKTNFIIRDSYSANAKTIKIDPKIARKEYIDNIVNSDFVLCPKGDGNFSVRFYEVLSLGRIPILIDTDMILPLNKDIDYSKFILRINYKDIHNIDKIVSDFYNKITEDEWIKMQSIARQEFVNHLNIVSFFKFILTKENIEKYIK